MSLNERFGQPKRLSAVPDPDKLAASIAAHPAGKARGQKWAEAKLAAQADALMLMQPNTGRNDALNSIAYSCGRLIPGGWLDEQHVHDTLHHAGMVCGLDQAEMIGFNGQGGTIRSGIDAGKREPRDPPITLDDPTQADTELPPPPPGVDPTTGEITRTTWWPKDLAGLISGEDDGEPAPAYLQREDGHHLLYAGKINALIGESESGKSWIALLAVVQTLQAGGRGTYLDFEDTAPGVLDRLRLLGATPEQLRQLAYISPLDAYTAQAQGDLAQHLASHKPHIIAFDGINAAMTLLGLNLLDNMDYTHFSLSVLRPLARTGAAVVTVDHVTKSKEGRGAYAIGAQAKRADIDGCALMVEVDKPFGRGMTGRLRLTVSKDRPGHVRAVSTGGKKAGTVILTSTVTAISGLIEAPDLRPADEREPFRPTHLMQKVSEYLERVGEGGASKANVEREVTGKRDVIRIALDTLVTEGYAESRTEMRGAVIHTSIKPYREALDLPTTTSPTSPRPRPDLAPGRGASRSTTSPPRPPVPTGARGEVNELAPGEDNNDNNEWWKK